MRLQLVVIPVSDVDRAKAFYRSAGFREEFDYASGDDFRVVRLSIDGSEASIAFGTGISPATPGSLQGLHLGVDDIHEARAQLIERGIDVGEIFHDVGGVFYRRPPWFDVPGPDPAGRDYASYARFIDPDGNGWLLQEARRSEPGSGRRFRTPPHDLKRGPSSGIGDDSADYPL